MKFLNIWLLILIFLINIFFIDIAKSQELQVRYQDWSVFKTERGDKIICYMASTPIKSEGNFDKRGEPFFLVTNIDNDSDEISTSSGFIYNKTSNVEINFGTKKYYLFPYKTIAWANDKNDDADIIKEMQKTPEMIVSGVARDGKIAIDSYSLIGFVQSYKKIKELCQNH